MLLSLVTDISKTCHRPQPASLSFDTIDTQSCQSLTGLTLENLDFVANELKLKNSKNWSKLDSIGVYFLKLKTSETIVLHFIFVYFRVCLL